MALPSIAEEFHMRHARHMLKTLYSIYIVRYQVVYLQIQSIEECRYRKVHYHLSSIYFYHQAGPLNQCINPYIFAGTDLFIISTQQSGILHPPIHHICLQVCPSCQQVSLCCLVCACESDMSTAESPISPLSTCEWFLSIT